MLDSRGWYQKAKHSMSPNFNARPGGVPVNLLVIHCISLPPERYGSGDVIAFFQNQLDTAKHSYYESIKDLKVSAHFFIDREGGITQFVSTHDRAWHAGVSQFDGQENCNDFSIGIELEGSDTDVFTDEQYQQLSVLTCAIQARYPGITQERIVGHSEIAPGRKSDPGTRFDWPRYRVGVKR